MELIVQKLVFNPDLVGKAIRLKYIGTDFGLDHGEERELREAKAKAPEGTYVVTAVTREGDELVLGRECRLNLNTLQNDYATIRVWEDEN